MQKNAKDLQLPQGFDWPQSTMSLSSAEKSFHAPEIHLMSLWILRGPNTVERRCSLYCGAISHISLCPWLPRSISNPPAPSAHNSEMPCESLASSPIYTAVEWSDCERLALPLLIGQGEPWEEPQDTSLIYYTHASPGHQREGSTLTRSITTHSPLLFFLIRLRTMHA